jgi:MinD-like ATPase involved in chromosome partitioning or flagellar assembly
LRKTQTLRVLVASRNKAIPAALAALQPGKTAIELVEAVSTGVAYSSLTGCALAIVDREDLIPSPGISPEMFGRTLAQSGIPVVSGAEFAASPSAWLERATAASGLLDALPPKAVMLTGYAGGTGKTTLALNLARHTSGTLHLPVAVIEVAFGAGSLRTLTDPSLPDLYDALTQGKEIGTWEGITVLPMNYASARLLLNRTEEVLDLVTQVIGRHVLTVVDAAGANPFRPVFQQATGHALVVADPRIDAIANARVMIDDLVEMGTDIVLNKVNGLGDQIAFSAIKVACKLPHVTRPEDDPRLAEGLLQVIYPGWKPRK